MAKDGEVVISTALDNSQLEKQLQDTKKKIVSLEEKLNKAEQERSPILAQLTEMEEKLRQATGEVKRFGEQWSSGNWVPTGSRWKPRLDWQHWSEKMTLC